MFWYLHAGDEQYGPAADEVVEAWIDEGRLRKTDLVWDPEAANWVPLEAHPRFAPASKPRAAPRPTPSPGRPPSP